VLVKRTVFYFAALYLLALVVLWLLIYYDRGVLWPITLFLFSPRWMAALPLLVLVPWTFAIRPRLTLIYILHLSIIFGPISGLRISTRQSVSSQNQTALRVLSCNVGAGPVHVDHLVELATSQNIDVMVLQECAPPTTEKLMEVLQWNRQQVGNMVICSPFKLGPKESVARHTASIYNPVAAMVCALEVPSSSRGDTKGVAPTLVVQVVCVHLPTFRPAFERVRQFDRQSGVAIQERGALYREIAEEVRTRVGTLAKPFVVAGDFNVPVESAYYRDYWSEYRNALDDVGSGYCYTKYTQLHGVRIDHVLCSEDWNVKTARVGPELGGDHRPVITELLLEN
jgi:vancomycin resistance protein VanJ